MSRFSPRSKYTHKSRVKAVVSSSKIAFFLFYYAFEKSQTYLCFPSKMAKKSITDKINFMSKSLTRILEVSKCIGLIVLRLSLENKFYFKIFLISGYSQAVGVHPKQAQHSNANTHRQRAQPSKPSSGFEAFPSQMLLPPSSNKPSNSHRYYYRAVLGYILCYTSR